MSVNRGTARSTIPKKIAELIRTIDGSEKWYSKIHPSNVETRLKFWDEVEYYPFVSVVAGPETREYLPSDFKWGFLNVSIKIYVRNDYEDPQSDLEDIFRDVEYLLEENYEIEYDIGKTTTDIRVSSITTDEGLLAPIGAGEVKIQVLYEVQ